jgi:hypothetical protein
MRLMAPAGHVVDICIWSIAELGSAITLTCVPAIMPLVKHHFPSFMASNTGMIIHWIPGTNDQAHGDLSSDGTAPVSKDHSDTCLELENLQLPELQK